MSPRPLIAVAALVVTLAVAACGSSTSTPTPSAPTSSAAAPSAAAPSAPGSSGPSPSAGGDAPTALPTFTRVPELEALLPKTVNGVTMEVLSLTGTDLVTGGLEANKKEVVALLDSVGAQPADLTFAQAADPKRVLPLMIGVYSVNGVDGAAFATAIIDRIVAAYPATRKTQETISGKQVTVVERTDASTGAVTIEAFYAAGDKLYRVSGPTRTYVADGLALIK